MCENPPVCCRQTRTRVAAVADRTAPRALMRGVTPAAWAISGADRLREKAGSVPPTSMVLLAIVSMQIGSATAKGLFDAVGPAGAVFLRVGVAAILCTAIWRLPARGLPLSEYATAALFGLVLAGMNFSFYSALDRIPLGVAVTLEFTGPLAVAIFGSRRLVDLLWGLLAAGGVIMLVFLIFLSLTGVYFFGNVLGLGLTLGALIVTVILLVVGGVLLGVGATILRGLDPKPRRTIGALQQNVEWIKGRIR